MSQSRIEWTDETWNPIRGCSRVSPGCEHCYAEVQARRHDHPGGAYEGLTVLTKKGPRWSGDVRPIPDKLDAPLRWRKPRRIFVNSMSDLFHEDAPNEYIAAVFGVMAACPQHTFQVLTKRAKRMREWFEWVGADEGAQEVVACQAARVLYPDNSAMHASFEFHTVAQDWPLPNVWLGVSVEDQPRADERIPLLLQCPAEVRWISAEPLLDSINLRKLPHPNHGMGISLGGALDWVVVGGESGRRARPCDLRWVRGIVAHCRDAGVPVFVKQLGALPMVPGAEDVSTGGWGQYVREEDAPDGADRTVLFDHGKGGDPSEWPHDLRIREWPAGGAPRGA